MDRELLKDAESFLRLHRRSRLSQGRFFRDVLGDLGLTVSQYTLLASVVEVGEARMADLAGAMGLTVSGVTPLVDRLIVKGHVVRRRTPEDRRLVLVSPTDEGKTILEEVMTRSREFAASLLRAIDPEKRRVFLEVYTRTMDVSDGTLSEDAPTTD